MFHEVRILDPNGKVKKVLSSKILSRRYWESFFEHPGAGKKAGKPGPKPKKGDKEYDESFFSED